MSDRPIRVLDEFAAQLKAAETRWESRRQTRRGRLLAAAAVAATALVAAPAAALTGGFDFGGNTPAPGQPGGPPPIVRDLAATTLNVLEVVNEPDGDQALRARVAPYGLKVRSQGRPVAPAAVGRVFGVQFPRRARFDSRGHMLLEPNSSGTIIVTRGRRARAAETASYSGLSLFEVLPQVQAAVRRENPRATLTALRQAGFEVKVKYVIDNPDRRGAAGATGVKDVASPPAGTVVLAVTNAAGQNAATPTTRSLILEVAPKGSDVARSHP